MKIIRYPKKENWAELLQRPAFDSADLSATVSTILGDVKANGDKSLQKYTKQFDGVEIDELLVSENEFVEAEKRVSDELKQAIQHAKSNIEKFHLSQTEEIKRVETTEGVICWRKSVAIEKVGLYIHAGTATLFSTVLMLAIPAKIAG